MDKFEEVIDDELLPLDKLKWVDLESDILENLKSKIGVRKKGINFIYKLNTKENSFISSIEKQKKIKFKKSEKLLIAILIRNKDIALSTKDILDNISISRSTLTRCVENLENLKVIEKENSIQSNGIKGFNKYKLREGAFK